MRNREINIEGFFELDDNEQEEIVSEVADGFFKELSRQRMSLPQGKTHIEGLIRMTEENEDYEISEVFKRIKLTIEHAMEYEQELREKNAKNVDLNRNMKY